MHVIVGGQEMEVATNPETTLGTLLDEVETEINQRREIVTRVSMDGREIDFSDQEAEGRSAHLTGAERIEVETEPASKAIAMALEEARGTMPNLLSRLDEVTSALQTGSRQEAFSIFAGCLEHWRSVVHLLQLASDLLGLREHTIVLKGRTLKTMNEELLGRLEDTKQAMEHDDLVGLSDLLDYEIRPRIEEEAQVLGRMIDVAKRQVSA